MPRSSPPSTCPRPSGCRAPPSILRWRLDVEPRWPGRARLDRLGGRGAARRRRPRRIRPRSAWRPVRRRWSTRPTERPPTRPGGPGWPRSNRTTSCSTGSSSGASADLRLLLNDGPRAGRALPRGRRALVRHAVRPRRDHRAPTSRSPSGPTSPSRPSRSSPPARRSSTTRGPTPSPARSSTRSGPARWPGPASCPFATYYGSVDSTPLWLILLGETHDWTGDDALVDRLWPNALAALAWIDQYGDLDGDGFVEYRRRADARPHQPGLEGLDRRDPRPGRPDGRAADRAGRGPGLRPRREAADGPPRPAPRRDRRWPTGSSARPTSSGPGSTPRSGWPTRGFYAMALDGDKRPMDALASNVGQALWGGIVDQARAPRPWSPRSAGRRSTRAGASGPTAPASRATTRSATTPARSGRTTTR